MNKEETKKPEEPKKSSVAKEDTRIRNLITNLDDPVMLKSAERIMREQQEDETQTHL